MFELPIYEEFLTYEQILFYLTPPPPQISGVPNSNKEVTVTIILLTVVFVFCNTVTITFAMVCAYTDVIAVHEIEDEDVVIKDDATIKSLYRLLFFFQQVLPLLNSTLNPVILIWRGAALRKSLKSFIFRGSTGDNKSIRISTISCAVLQPS